MGLCYRLGRISTSFRQYDTVSLYTFLLCSDYRSRICNDNRQSRTFAADTFVVAQGLQLAVLYRDCRLQPPFSQTNVSLSKIGTSTFQTPHPETATQQVPNDSQVYHYSGDVTTHTSKILRTSWLQRRLILQACLANPHITSRPTHSERGGPSMYPLLHEITSNTQVKTPGIPSIT